MEKSLKKNIKKSQILDNLLLIIFKESNLAHVQIES